MSNEWEQIHAQINAIVRAIPEHFLLDPPDGGDVTVAEGVLRMADRIAQLEAALRAAYEVYAGSEGFIPETCAEGYQRQIITQMVGCISSALEERT